MPHPTAIEIGTETSPYGTVVLNLPGRLLAGDTLEDAVTGAEVSAAAWMSAVNLSGQFVW